MYTFITLLQNPKKRVITTQPIPMSSTPTNQTEEEEDRLDIKICAGNCRKPDCCTDKIFSSIHDDALKWKKMDNEKIVTNTPLHEAAKVGNTAVVVEILNLMPSLGRKLNKEGLSPLHLAIDKGHSKTVRALLKFDRSLVRVKGKEGETPLMLCAGKVDEPGYNKLLATLLLACPQSVRDVNNRCETVVHVALRKGKSEAVRILVDWIERRNEIASVLTVKDVDGDTPLHTAARFGCVQVRVYLFLDRALY